MKQFTKIRLKLENSHNSYKAMKLRYKKWKIL